MFIDVWYYVITVFLNSLIYYEKEIWLESWEIFLKTMII